MGMPSTRMPEDFYGKADRPGVYSHTERRHAMDARFVRFWKPIAEAVAILFLFLVFFGKFQIAERLFLSFVNGESSVAFWVAAGTPFVPAVAIAIACSSFDIFSYYCGFALLKRFYKEMAKPLYEEIDSRTDLSAIDGNAEWARNAYRWGIGIYRFAVPQPSEDEREGSRSSRRMLWHYAQLYRYGLTPGSIWTGVGYSFAFKMDLLASGIVVGIGNITKMLLCGYFSIKIPLWSVIPVFVLGPMCLRHAIGRLRRHCSVAHPFPAKE